MRKVQPYEVRVEEGELGPERRGMRAFLPAPPGGPPRAAEVVIGTVGRGRRRRRPQLVEEDGAGLQQTTVTDFMRPVRRIESAAPSGVTPRVGLGSYPRREFIVERRAPPPPRTERVRNTNPFTFVMGDGRVYVGAVPGPEEVRTGTEKVFQDFEEAIGRQPKRSRRQRLALGSVVRLVGDMERRLAASRLLSEEEYAEEEEDAEECGDSGQEGDGRAEEERTETATRGGVDITGERGERMELVWSEPPGD
jgi:hypothetical protein